MSSQARLIREIGLCCRLVTQQGKRRICEVSSSMDGISEIIYRFFKDFNCKGDSRIMTMYHDWVVSKIFIGFLWHIFIIIDNEN